MSSARLRLLAAVTGLALAGPPPVRAQQTEEELVRHLREVTARIPEAERAVAAEAARRDAMVVAVPGPAVDTFEVGPLRILAPPDQRALAERLFGEVWEREYAPFLTASPALERVRFTFHWGGAMQGIRVLEPVRRVEMRAWRSEDAVRENLRQAIASVLVDDLPGPLRSWANAPIREPRDPRRLHLEIAAAPSIGVRSCLDGSTEACLSVLRLRTDGTPLDEWYTPQERRALVGRYGWGREREPQRRACVEGGSIQACDALLDDERWAAPSPIRDQGVQGSVLWTALLAGGAGAWDRLRADPGAAPLDALLRASRLDEGELISTWRAWLDDSGPGRRGLGSLPIPFYLLWIAVFAALAMRSTRWRLG